MKRFFLFFLNWYKSLQNTFFPKIRINVTVIYPEGLNKLKYENGIYHEVMQNGDEYHLSMPIKIPKRSIQKAVDSIENWIKEKGIKGIKFSVQEIDSVFLLSEYRKNIGNVLDLKIRKDVIDIYLIRGMGGFAGTKRAGGWAALGDVCLEALAEYSEPNAASVLMRAWSGEEGRAYKRGGQRGALAHEIMHTLSLPHVEDWSEENRPDPNKTVMANWPAFPNVGLSPQEVENVNFFINKWKGLYKLYF